MSETINKRLIIVDPSLKDERGHHYALTKVISEGAVKQDVEVIWFANRNHTLKAISGIKIIPTFSASMYDLVTAKSDKTLIDIHFISRIPEFLHPVLIKIRDLVKGFVPAKYKTYLLGINSVEPGFQKFAKELHSSLTQEKIGRNDHLLIHSADGTIYRGVLALALDKGQWDNVPMIHMCTSYDECIMPEYNNGLSVTRIIDYFKLLGLLDERIFLYAENHSLTAHLENLWGVAIRTLEIPSSGSSAIMEPACKDVLNVVYLGAAREEKGFHLLPEVIRIIQANAESKKAIRFVLQCSPQIIGYLPIIKKALAKLKQYPADFVRLVEQQQTMDEYYAMLDEADVVLLCYERDNYKVRGSGIAVEAVTRGKIMIVSPNTFPAEIAENAGVLAENAKQIAEKLITISENYEQHAQAALKRMRDYNASHSAENYVKFLLSTQAKNIDSQTYNESKLQVSRKISTYDVKPKRLVKSPCIKNTANPVGQFSKVKY